MSTECYNFDLQRVYFMCDTCYRIIKFDDFNVNISFEDKLSSHNSKYDWFDLNPQMAFQMKCCCNDCNNGTLIMIDPKIVYPVVRLNRLGLLTEYSCEGHYILHDSVIDEPHYIPPYIAFFKEATQKFIDNGLTIPQEWDCEVREEGGLSITANEMTDDNPFDEDSFNKYKERKLQLLEEWISLLECNPRLKLKTTLSD